MTNYLKFFYTLLFFVLLGTTGPQAADAETESDSPIDIMGTVADHDYFTFFGKKLYLPRLFLWENDLGELKFSTYSSTKKAFASGDFIGIW